MKTALYLLILLSLLAACGGDDKSAGNDKPAPSSTPTLDDLSKAAMTASDLPDGFEAVDEYEFLTAIVMESFPEAETVAFTAFGERGEGGKFNAVVVSYIFYPLSESDIETFTRAETDLELAMDTFANGVQYAMQVSPAEGEGSIIGDSHLTMTQTLSAGLYANAVISRRQNIGQVVMVVSSSQWTNLGLAEDTAIALDRHVQDVLGK